jgi:hypothetical protein
MPAEQIVGPQWSSYNQLIEHILQIDPLIYMLSPEDLPLLTGVGSNGLAVLPSKPVSNRVFYWQEENMPLPRGTLATTVNSSVTTFVMTAGHAIRFAVGDHIRIGDEAVRVTAVDTATDELTVVRNALGTTAAGHTAPKDCVGIGTALPEGDIGSANYLGREKFSNYTQIFSGKVRVTRTEQRIPKYGVPNELVKQMLNRTQHLMLGVEQAALYGIKHETTGTRVRSTGGLRSFISTNVNSAAAWLTVATIEAEQQKVYNLGGMFDMIVAQPRHFLALNNLAGSERIQTVTIEDPRRGRRNAQVVMTEFGAVNLVRNRWVADADAFCYSRENFIKRDFQPLITQPLAKTNDTDEFMLVTECGFEVKGQDHMARFSALTPGASLPSSGLV